MSQQLGFTDYTPTPEKAALIAATNQILDQYRQYGQMTLRQIFYRLVASYGYGKTEREYKNLGKVLTRARRAGLVSFTGIRDDGVRSNLPGGYDGPADLWEALEHTAGRFALSRVEDAPDIVEVHVEAAGMLPQAQQAVAGLGVRTVSNSGYPSVTFKHDLAQRVTRALDEGRTFTVLHVGDHDPSGVDLYENQRDDVGTFAVQLVDDYDSTEALRFVRLAITEDQAIEGDYPSAPPKRSDARSVNWDGETWQAEAIPPDELQQIIRGAALEYVNQDWLQDLADAEAEIRPRLQEWLGDRERFENIVGDWTREEIAR